MNTYLISAVGILHIYFFIFNGNDVEVPVMLYLDLDIILKRIYSYQLSSAYDPHLLITSSGYAHKRKRRDQGRQRQKKEK